MTTDEYLRGVVVGSTLVPAMISPVSGGLVRTWTRTESKLWGVEDPDWLGGVLGRGLVGRTPMPDNRFREALLLNPDTGTLLVQGRFVSGSGEAPQVQANRVQLGKPTRPETNPWKDLKHFLTAAAISAAERDEFYVAELGGWNAPSDPYCLFAVLDQGSGPVSLLEAAPAPRGTGIWPEVPRDQPGATVTSPPTESSLSVAGAFVASAINTWGVTPWDVALTFGTVGSGA
ncbi:hypothetical protein BFN03_12435 [Rhodococcus sp. WMMA185]|uniref:hypothetical protein n=1 Tax=Rhodococcus sp. WMMA185 TaxID=679318 RepID=UPI00087812DB|nr:hypothetical protein [Rhodococcus sp. WMMA185]AOW93177.1 hypothetical protein BFN03_12435 [Rhodococcus sp. WMMA185]